MFSVELDIAWDEGYYEGDGAAQESQSAGVPN